MPLIMQIIGAAGGLLVLISLWAILALRKEQ